MTIRFVQHLIIEATAGQVVQLDDALAARLCELGFAEPVKRAEVTEAADEPTNLETR